MVALISVLIAVTGQEAEVVVVDLPIRELEARWGITRNALKSRAAALGVELVRVSSTDTRWPGAFIDLADDLHQHLQQGGTLKDFPGSKASITGGSGAISATKKASGAAAEDLALALAKAMGNTLSLPTADPLRRAKALAEAADNALVLTTDELVAIGVKGVDGFADGDLAFGYAFSKHQQRNRTLWTIERVIGKKPVTDGTAQALTAGKADKQVGFGLGATLAARGGATIFANNTLR
jgi:hypothetical protein